MDNKYSNIRIKINNQAEKLAALYFLAAKTGLKISSSVLDATLNNRCIGDFCFVYSHSMISASCKADNSTIVEFSDLKNFDSYLAPKFVEVVLNKEHTAKVYKDKVVVGCQNFPISVIGDLVRAREKIDSK
jgi:hypothetical protein